MADQTNGGQLIGITEFSKRLADIKRPSPQVIAKEKQKMGVDTENLNAMEQVVPNPLNQGIGKKKKNKTVKTAMSMFPNAQDATGDVIDWFKKNIRSGGDEEKPVNSDDLNKLLKGLASTGKDPLAEMLSAYQDSLETPNYKPYRAPINYRFPGYFQG